MDKIKINNQIVSMRKFVKQAKIHFINKYVKECRQLQNRHGDEDQVSKSKRRAERLLLEINILKKIKPDCVSRMALAKSKDWEAVLKQKDISFEDRCFANLANFKPVQKEVEKFHSANRYLVPKINTLLQEWEEKAKLTPEGSQKNESPTKNDKASETPGNESGIFKIKAKPEVDNAQPKKFQPTVKEPLEAENNSSSDVDHNSSDSSSEDDEKMEENEHFSDEDNLNVINSENKLIKSKIENENIGNEFNPHETDSFSSELDEAESISQSSEDEEHEDKIPMKKLKTDKNTITSQKSELKVNSVKNNPKSPKISLKANKITNKPPTFQKNVSPKGNSTKAVALLNLNEMLDMDEIPIDNNKTVVERVEETAKRKRDTFFLSGDGDDFSESGDDEDTGNGRQDTNFSPLSKKPRNAFNKRGSFNEGGMKNENGFKNRKNFGNSPQFQKFGFRENKFQKNRKEFNSNKQSNKFERNPERPENNFNKSRFSNFEKNDKRHENSFNKNKKWNPKDASNRTEERSFKTSGKFFEKNTNFKRNDNSSHTREGFSQSGKKDEPPLHPSWEAKRKLKTTAKTKFQGKRVVFDD